MNPVAGSCSNLPPPVSRPIVTVIRPSRARCVKRERYHVTSVQSCRGFRFSGKAQTEQLFSGLPPKAELPPDLRTTPAASSSRTLPSVVSRVFRTLGSRKRSYLPILELLRLPVLRERCHR